MDKALRPHIKGLGKKHLLVQGFVQAAVGQYLRELPHLDQMVHVFQHRDRFTLRVFWRYREKPFSVTDGYDFARDLESIIGPPGWFSTSETESLEQGIKAVENALTDQVLPFLNRYMDVPSIVSGVQAGDLDDRVFGLDPLRKLVTRALCLEISGRSDEAKNRFKEAVEYSGRLNDLSQQEELWVEEARRRAQ